MSSPLHPTDRLSVLVTGGAGFVGRHLVDALVVAGHRVRVLDNLDPQAHEGGIAPPLADDVDLRVGDLRDRATVRQALDGVDAVFHQAGMVGNGQSMYELHRYIDVNAGGTAVLLEEVLDRRDRVRRLVVASSMVVYGEGRYHCDEHGDLSPGLRREDAMAARFWEPTCPHCGRDVEAIPTPEDAPLQPTSTYAISKRDCEELCLITGRAHGLDVVALRYLNVFGPGQALSNPYTGVAAIFSTRLLNGRRPLIFEDGLQRRDLVHISDVVAANLLALQAPAAVGHAINVGTGDSIRIVDLARQLAHDLGVNVEPDISGRFRAGDIRHCWADTTRAQRLLGFRASADRRRCLRELADWVRGQSPVDRTESATAVLAGRSLIR